MANPIKTWVASPLTGTAVGNASVTVTINFTQAWEMQVNIGVVFGASVSLAPVILFYPSSDGGTNFATEPLVSFSIVATASATKRAPIRLTTGQYAIQMRNSGPSATFFILTMEAITAIS